MAAADNLGPQFAPQSPNYEYASNAHYFRMTTGQQASTKQHARSEVALAKQARVAGDSKKSRAHLRFAATLRDQAAAGSFSSYRKKT